MKKKLMTNDQKDKKGIKKSDDKKKKIMKKRKRDISEISKIPSPLSNNTLSEKIKITKNLMEKYAPGTDFFDQLWNLKPSEPGKVMMFGKIVDIPRWQVPFINDYNFSGLKHNAILEVPEILKPFYDWAQETEFAKDEHGLFNQIMINGYANGSEYIGKHSDDESQLFDNSVILSISLGQTRTFRITGKKDGLKIMDVYLEHGDCIAMKNNFQKLYKHEIVKVGGTKGEKLGKRINLTFRKFK